MTKDKLLIISDKAPPMNDGPCTLLYNLLSKPNDLDYGILTRYPGYYWNVSMDDDLRLPCAYYYSYVIGPNIIRNTYLKSLFNLAELILIPTTILKGLLLLKRHRYTKIVVVVNTNSVHFFISAYIISKFANVDLYLYITDACDGYMRNSVHLLFNKLFEKRIFKYAKKIFGMSEYLKRHYEGKHSVSLVVLNQSVDISKYSDCDKTDLNTGKNKDVYRDKKKYTIVFTGVVSNAQFDCITDLVDVVNDCKGILKFELYTPTSIADLDKNGIRESNYVHLSYADKRDIPQIQKRADILFLPLAFKSHHKTVIRTAAPTKIGEYLAAGRPIVVYAPGYSFLASYARKNKFAMVIDAKNKAELLKGIKRIVSDPDYRRELVYYAGLILKKHDSRAISNTFLAGIGCLK